MNDKRSPLRGRGSSDNPENRFIGKYIDYDLDAVTGEKPSVKTQLIRDDTQSLITHNRSKDVPFESSINPYRGCEHGCIYCYARPYHEYLGFSSGLDFETKIMVKYDAAKILRKELMHPRYEPKVIAVSGVTDVYQPIEKKLEITRNCLEVMAEFRNPIGLITKNHLVCRDIDILSELSKYDCAKVTLSITTLDRELARVMEPRTSSPDRRLDAIRRLSDAGIPVGVNIAPVIPGLTDHEIPAILEAARKAGACSASYIMLRLPFNVKELFVEWLEDYYPDRKTKVVNKIKEMRDGKLNSADWGNRMRGEGITALHISRLFRISTKRLGMNDQKTVLSTEHFVRSHGKQTSLF